MTARRFYWLPFGLGALGMLGAGLALVSAGQALAPELPTVGALAEACAQVLPWPPATALLVGALAALGATVSLLAARAIVRGWRSQRRLRDGWQTAGCGVVRGTRVTWIDDERPIALCAGLLRPRVYVSTGGRWVLSADQLTAVVAHERHHARRRDPLRILLLSALAESIPFMPVLPRLVARYRALAELAADEAAVRAAGRSALASALLQFGRRAHPEAVVGIAPERVDQLIGRRLAWRVPMRSARASLLVVTAMLALPALAGALIRVGSVPMADAAMGLCSTLLILLAAVGLRLTASAVRSKVGQPAV